MLSVRVACFCLSISEDIVGRKYYVHEDKKDIVLITSIKFYYFTICLIIIIYYYLLSQFSYYQLRQMKRFSPHVILNSFISVFNSEKWIYIGGCKCAI